MARITYKTVEEKAARINKCKKIVHVEHRNNYLAIDSPDGKICYDCGLSTKEAYQYLNGIELGIDILTKELEKQFGKNCKRQCE